MRSPKSLDYIQDERNTFRSYGANRTVDSNGKIVNRPIDSEILLTPSEVAALFRVDPKTVTRWAKAGKLTAIRTLGGHRRYRASEVNSLLESSSKGESTQ